MIHQLLNSRQSNGVASSIIWIKNSVDPDQLVYNFEKGMCLLRLFWGNMVTKIPAYVDAYLG